MNQPDPYPGPPWYQFNGHWQTVLPAFGGPKVAYQRERLELADGDFLDLDWLRQRTPARQLVILTHGLEGNSSRPYVRSAAR
ncbi:MAG: alpha/beta hydrolase, partial [Bacteroidetes bacterium]